MRDLAPIIKTLLKAKASPLLLILQIAITFMVMVNAANMLSERSKNMARPIGVDEVNSFYVQTNLQGESNALGARLDEDLALLRALPAVQGVTPMSAIPLEAWGRATVINKVPEKVFEHGAYFAVDETVVEVLGLNLIAGENLSVEDVYTLPMDGVDLSTNILITKALAQSLSPDDWQQAVGMTVYLSKDIPQQVKGVVETMQGPWQQWYGVELNVISPIREAYNEVRYFVRTNPGLRDEAMEQVLDALLKTPGRMIENAKTLEAVKFEAYQSDRATSKLLIGVCLGLLIVTGLGIYGQARFSVNRRKRQIGTRRALGASKGQVMRFFMLENAVVSLTGLVIGFVAALSLSEQFVQHFGLTPVPLPYLLSGMAALFVLGQLSVSYPALQASRVEPAIATRSA
jgi:putative ABC transport system permease protein